MLGSVQMVVGPQQQSDITAMALLYAGRNESMVVTGVPHVEHLDDAVKMTERTGRVALALLVGYRDVLEKRIDVLAATLHRTRQEDEELESNRAIVRMLDGNCIGSLEQELSHG